MKSVLIFLLCTVIIGSANTCFADNQLTVSQQQAYQAYEYALEYVNNEVAYLYGGRISVEQYLTELALCKEPGVDIGVDASALVVNSYRNVISDIRFWFDDTKTTTVSDATSNILAEFNSNPLAQSEIVPGDLIFFKNAAGNINGVAIFSHIQGNVIHFITASANKGKVVLTNARLDGNYWADAFGGFGRLTCPLNQ